MRYERARWRSSTSLLLLVCACTNTVDAEGSYADVSHCAPGTTRSCPCLGGGMGSQICDDTGGRYGTCIGCANDTADAGAPGAQEHSGAGPGIACGVAFPVLCAPERETCCARSLSVDTCIASASECACDSLDCVATAVRCDGPEDCPSGQSCCGSPTLDADDARSYASFACAVRCASDQRKACHAGRTSCPLGLLCTNSQFLTNMQVCVDPASLAQ